MKNFLNKIQNFLNKKNDFFFIFYFGLVLVGIILGVAFKMPWTEKLLTIIIALASPGIYLTAVYSLRFNNAGMLVVLVFFIFFGIFIGVLDYALAPGSVKLYILASIIAFILAVIHSFLRNKKMKLIWKAEAIEAEAKKAQAKKEAEEKIAHQKAMMEMVLSVFFNSNAPFMDAKEIEEILASKIQIDKLESSDNPEEVSTLLHQITAKIPVSNQPLLFAVVAQALANVRKSSIEDVCNSRIISA